MPHVLVVDDHQPTRLLVRGILQTTSGFRIREAAGVSEAWEFTSTMRPVAVIADQNMPDGTGLDLVRRIRASTDPTISKIPFMLLTGDARCLLVLQARKEGVQQFCVKPIVPAALLRKTLTLIAAWRRPLTAENVFDQLGDQLSISSGPDAACSG